ncbi:MAG: hypothetical protein AB8F95_03680 [Bacteroidia bacterium]
MGFFGWLFTIMFAIWFIGRVFGKYILAWGVKRIQKKVMSEMSKQANAYSEQYQNPDGRKEKRVDRDMTVEYKEESSSSKEPEWNQLAEDVDFEDIPVSE